MWRSMQARDLTAVVALAAQAHVAYPERDEVFAERLALAPDMCLVHETNGDFAGYLIAHPWREGPPPALDTLLGTLPDGADLVHLHDCVIAPPARGRGGAAGGLAALVARTRGRFRAIGLVAVDGKDAYWSRFGFRPVAAPAPGTSLDDYGPRAVPMRLLLDGTP